MIVVVTAYFLFGLFCQLPSYIYYSFVSYKESKTELNYKTALLLSLVYSVIGMMFLPPIPDDPTSFAIVISSLIISVMLSVIVRFIQLIGE